MVNVCNATNQQVMCIWHSFSHPSNYSFLGNSFRTGFSIGLRFFSTAIVIKNGCTKGAWLQSHWLEAPLLATTVSWGEAGVCARARRPTGKRSASRARPRTTAQATSRGDFYPLHPFRPHHGRPSGCGGRGGRTRLRQAGCVEAEERARSEEPQVHRALLQATDLLQPLHRLHLVSMQEDAKVLLHVNGHEGHRWLTWCSWQEKHQSVWTLSDIRSAVNTEQRRRAQTEKTSASRNESSAMLHLCEMFRFQCACVFMQLRHIYLGSYLPVVRINVNCLSREIPCAMIKPSSSSS